MPSPANYAEPHSEGPPTAGERFAFALFLAVCLHAILILGVNFSLPERPATPPTLEVTLAPLNAEAESAAGNSPPANPNQGAGDRLLDEPSATSPSPKIPATVAQRLDAPAPQDRPASADAGAPGGAVEPEQAPYASEPRRDYAALSRDVAALGLEIAERSQEAGSAPRTRRLSSSSRKTAVEAAYLDMWRQRVERIGAANYPANSAGGDLRMLVVIREDGALIDARVLHSSGIPGLDAAALRIIRLAAPFAPFSVDMRKSYQQLEITRTWRFRRSGAKLID